MSKKTRDYLFIFFIILFVTGTFFISLYASGFKINFSWPLKYNRLLIKTGMIALDSNPDGATIYLDGVQQANFSINPWRKKYLTTAAKIKNVLPGDYDLVLERDGYWPFEKKITVYSGQTTFLENINLFRSDVPLLIASSPETGLKISSSGKYLYARDKVIALKDDNKETAAAPDGSWLKNSDKLLSGGVIYDPAKGSNSDYRQLLGTEVEAWFEDESNNRLYYQSANSIGYLDLGNNNSVVVVSGGDYLAFEARGNDLYYIADSSGHLSLEHYSIRDQKVVQELALPGVAHYTFSSEGRKYLSLYDDRNKTLYIINPDDIENGLKKIDNVLSWQWTDDNDLFYNNSWEIYSFDVQNGTSNLVTRVGQQVGKIVWNQARNFLIFSTPDSLEAYDLRTGILTRIFQTERIFSPVLDEKDNTLYFWAKIGNQEGAYSLLLQ